MAKLSIEQLDDLNSSLNVLLKSVVEDTDQFPPLDMLEEVKQSLEYQVHSNLLSQQRANFVALSWPANLRTMVRRLFQTFNIPDEYIRMNYELCNCAAQALGIDWFKSDAEFLRLLASLSSGRLRIILEEPSKVDLSLLIACLQLQEYFFKCVEDDQEWLSDEEATFVSKCCQEAATFVCEYLVEFTKKRDITMNMEMFLVIYRYLCAFLNVGGAQIITKRLLSDALPTLLQICQFCIDQRDGLSAGYLLSSITEFETLPAETLSTLLHFIRLQLPTENAKESIVQFSAILEQLKDRKGWFTPEALAEAEALANTVKDRRVTELLNHVKTKNTKT